VTFIQYLVRQVARTQRCAQSPGRPTEIQYSAGRRNFRPVLHHCPIESELDGPASLFDKGRVREQLPTKLPVEAVEISNAKQQRESNLLVIN
jgi:hypothetical protein